MKSMAANLLGSAADAEDAGPGGVPQGVPGRAGVRAGASVATWLYRILVNTCYDQLRGTAPPRRGRADGVVRRGVTSAAGARPSAAARDRVGGGPPPERERAAFLLCEVEGFSHSEAAEILEVPEATSRTLLFRARRELQRGCRRRARSVRRRRREGRAAATSSARSRAAIRRCWRRSRRTPSRARPARASCAGWRARLGRGALAAESSGARRSSGRGSTSASPKSRRARRRRRRGARGRASCRPRRSSRSSRSRRPGLLVFRNAGGRDPLVSHWETTKAPLLEEQAVDEVESAERTYLASIDNLSRLAQPRLAGRDVARPHELPREARRARLRDRGAEGPRSSRTATTPTCGESSSPCTRRSSRRCRT
jgi:RNA polymerase sigma-70 factor (ECF subfamily)